LLPSTRAGYIFEGWYASAVFDGDAVTQIIQGAFGNIGLFAKWSVDFFTIDYVPNGGKPIGMAGDSVPGERTVYVEATAAIDADGIAPPELLELARRSLVSDPVTGRSRIILGQSADTLYVRSITRTGIYVTIVGLSIGSGDIEGVKQNVKAVLEAMLRGIEPYVEGLDAEFDRRDKLTESLLMVEAQNTIDRNGGTIQNILFGKTPTENLSRIDLRRNEKLSLRQILFTDG
jgi:uncharacterized repeat protein (TIGR02543 family)